MGGFQKKVYESLPYPFKFILLNIKGYLNTKQRYNKEFAWYLNKHKELWAADINTVLAYQKERLAVLLSESFEYSDWYSPIMKDLGITLEEIQQDPIAVLNKMPILTKKERREKVDLIVNKKRETGMVGHTSGTSGSPMIDYIDVESINASFAIWKRFHHVIGVPEKSKQIRFSGRLIVDVKTQKPPFWVYNISEKQLLMSTYHLTEDNLKHYVAKIGKFKPALIDGYPSAIYIISRYINTHKITFDFVPNAIAVTAETLYDYQRIEIEKAFGCQVYNQYASSEGSPFITECVNGNLHLNLDSGVFEFVTTEGKPAQPGEIANLVVTSFINYKTPLIRYNIQDTVLLPKEPVLCDCGCVMPVIEKLIGREDDILWTEEKGYVGRMDTAYKGLDGIVKGQIIQETANKVVVNLVIDQNFNDQMKANLLQNLKERLGERIDYQIRTVDDIVLGPNGKFDAVKRNFKLDV